jgi:hypothetical protein
MPEQDIFESFELDFDFDFMSMEVSDQREGQAYYTDGSNNLGWGGFAGYSVIEDFFGATAIDENKWLITGTPLMTTSGTRKVVQLDVGEELKSFTFTEPLENIGKIVFEADMYYEDAAGGDYTTWLGVTNSAFTKFVMLFSYGASGLSAERWKAETTDNAGETWSPEINISGYTWHTLKIEIMRNKVVFWIDTTKVATLNGNIPKSDDLQIYIKCGVGLGLLQLDRARLYYLGSPQ